MMENKYLADQAEELNDLLTQLTDLLDEEMFDDIRERAAEAKDLLSRVISEYGIEQADNSFRLY